MQLVAIKRLQSRGMALVQVQESLVGANDRSLARWAALPVVFPGVGGYILIVRRPVIANYLRYQPRDGGGETLARSASEGKALPVPRLRFGLVWAYE